MTSISETHLFIISIERKDGETDPGKKAKSAFRKQECVLEKGRSGADVMILKIFSAKKIDEKVAFLLKTMLNYAKI
jgi:hypothetical protein